MSLIKFERNVREYQCNTLQEALSFAALFGHYTEIEERHGKIIVKI